MAALTWGGRAHRVSSYTTLLDSTVGRGTSGHLPEMRSHGDGRLTHRGGGSWELVTVQEPMLDGFGHRMEPAVEFELRDGRPQQARVRLTSGEARVLATQLLHAADQLDLEG